MTHPDLASALSPLMVTLSSLRARQGAGATDGLAKPLVVGNARAWTPATELIRGTALDAMLDTARVRWGAAPHAAATLAWKSYSYWLAMPAVLSWASARRVPYVDAENVLARFSSAPPSLRLGLRTAHMAVLPDDPLALIGHPDITVVADEAALLRTLRVSLLDRHLDPLSERIRAEVKVGRRTLLGSVASGIAYAVIRAGHGLPGSGIETAATLLDALDLSDLVDLVPGESGDASVRRRTCCLAFTLPQPKVCSGCCLRD